MREHYTIRRPESPRRIVIIFLACVSAAVMAAFTPMSPTDAAYRTNAAVRNAPEIGVFLITVNNTGDGGNQVGAPNCDADLGTDGEQCTLRAAIQAANLSPGDDGIEFAIPPTEPNCTVGGACTINLNTPLPALTEAISITGPGSDKLTVIRNGNNPQAFVIFEIKAPGITNISRLTVRKGITEQHPVGAGINNESTGTVNLRNLVVTQSGGQFNQGWAVLNRAGTMNVIESTITDNNGVGIGNYAGASLNVIGSTVSNNQAVFEAGGIASNGPLTVVNSTISGNTASSGTGGIIAAGPSGYIANSTVVKNRAGTSFSDFGSGGVAGTATLTSSIVAQNIQGPNTPPNLRGTFTSQGYNVIESTDGSMFTAGQGDQIVVSETQLALGPLQDNGGPTLTHAPGTGSVAIDQGIANSLTTDQRGTGFPRTNDDPAVANAVGGDGTDTGAFEVHQDTDGDGIVDALDPDDDDDGVADGEDAFPLDSAETTDTDSDGTGDNADTDDDGDGVLDGADNCPLNANADQADFDLDGIGDACDPATGPPSNKEQCKNGGWMRFDTPSFGNQGDCTRFLRTGG